MFGLFSKKKKPVSALDEVIITIYGNPPPAKRADVGEAVELAKELLGNSVDEIEIRRQAIVLSDSPIPYSTHDLALAVSLHFFKQPENIPRFFDAQLLARMKMIQWLESGLVAPIFVQSVESVLYRLYKPGA